MFLNSVGQSQFQSSPWDRLVTVLGLTADQHPSVFSAAFICPRVQIPGGAHSEGLPQSLLSRRSSSSWGAQPVARIPAVLSVSSEWMEHTARRELVTLVHRLQLLPALVALKPLALLRHAAGAGGREPPTAADGPCSASTRLAACALSAAG